MKSTRLRKRSVIVALSIIMLQLASSGCVSLFPQVSHAKIVPAEQPIVSAYQPPRVLQFCVDTKPLMPDALFRAAVSAVADMLSGSVNVNSGRAQIYISYITSSSYLKDAFSFTIPSLHADPLRPVLDPLPNPASFHSQYDYSDSLDKVNKENAARIAAWQVELKRNHQKLAANAALVKQNTQRLRSLPNLFDPAPESVAGCLQSYSERVAGFHSRKTLIIASPLVNMVNNANGINLAGSTVEVIFRSCELANSDACIAEASAWKQRLLSFGASSVSIRDPQQSLVEPLTF